MNRPDGCHACTRRKCLDTGKPCDDVERWINQDFVGQNSVERMGNGSSDFGDSLTFLDISSFYHSAPVEPDQDAAEEAWKTVKSLRLKRKHLEIIRLFYKEGKRICECSLELKIPDQTAWARKKKATEQVRDRLMRLEFWSKNKFRRFPTDNSRTISRLYFRDLMSRKETADITGFTLGCIGKNIRKVIKLFG